MAGGCALNSGGNIVAWSALRYWFSEKDKGQDEDIETVL